MVRGHGDGGDVTVFGTEIEGESDGAVLSPVLLPPRLQRMRQDGEQFRIAAAEGLLTELEKPRELICFGVGTAEGVAQTEVVHRFGAV